MVSSASRQDMQGASAGKSGQETIRLCPPRTALWCPGMKKGASARVMTVQEAGVVSVHGARGAGPPVLMRGGARCPEADTKVAVVE